jgi:phosphonatase-like hydrolase
MGIELIVFDLAGTTVRDNKDVHRMLKNAMKLFGVAISIDEANAVMGIPKPVAIKQLLEAKNYPDISPELIHHIHVEFVEQMMNFYRNDPSVGEKEGVSDTFKILKERGIKIVVDTGFDRQITDPLLARLGWKLEKLIDASVTSDEVEHGRPFPDLIFRAMQLTGVTDVKKVVKVGDTPSDLLEGTNAGCQFVIGITSGAFSRTQLEVEPHTHLVDQVPDILNILELAEV